jgi:hypothetical protein
MSFFFARSLFLLLLPLVITFCLHIVIFFFPRRQTNERPTERTKEQTNGNSSSYAMFIFCLPLLTFCLLHHSSFFWHQIGYDDDDDDKDDDDANANFNTASCRPKRPFKNFQM